jgi:hypothetical protein
MTLTDAQPQMKSVSAFIVDSTDMTSEYVASWTAIVSDVNCLVT